MTTEGTPAAAPEATVQETPAQVAERNSIVGHRNLSSHENAALLERLEKNGTPLEQVNAITRKYGTEITEDHRTDYERAYDAANPVAETPEGYNINVVPALPHSALSNDKAVAELAQHANAFSHALEIPKAQAGELFRDLLKASNDLAAMKPEQAAAWKEREANLLARALGGVDKLEAAMKTVSDLLARANNPELVLAMAPALNSSIIFMRFLHHAQLRNQRAARQTQRS